MNNFKNHYNNIITYDLLTKLNLNNIFQLPEIEKITLNIGLKDSNTEKKKMIPIILLIKLLTNQNIILTKSKKNLINFKIKKGSIMGCKVTLRKKNLYYFFEKIMFFIFPNIKEFQGYKINTKNTKILNFKILNILNFFELEKEFLKFQKIPPIDISIHIKNSSKNESYLLLNNFYFPFQKQKQK